MAWPSSPLILAGQILRLSREDGQVRIMAAQPQATPPRTSRLHDLAEDLRAHGDGSAAEVIARPSEPLGGVVTVRASQLPSWLLVIKKISS
jgi:hypothetical protein